MKINMKSTHLHLHKDDIDLNCPLGAILHDTWYLDVTCVSYAYAYYDTLPLIPSLEQFERRDLNEKTYYPGPYTCTKCGRSFCEECTK